MKSSKALEIAFSSSAQFFVIQAEYDFAVKAIENCRSFQSDNLFFVSASELNTENARFFVSELSKTTINRDIYVIRFFDKLSQSAQNILLKSLESIGNGKVVIGVCEHTQGLLDTILSRAYYVYIPTDEEIISKEFIDQTLPKTVVLKNAESFLDETAVLSKKLFHSKDCGEEVARFVFENRNMLDYFRRIEANCNKDLCFDLLIYKLLEGK